MTQHNSNQTWAIVGGGFLGMTLALRLAQQGKPVTLFEASKSLGGLASAWQLGDIVWDRHYHVTLGSDTYLRSFLRELGLEDNLRWTKAQTGFFVDSNLYSMSSTLEFLRFPPLNLFEKLRLGATVLRASRIRNAKPLERVPVEDWLTWWSGPAVTQKIWLPLLRAKLGDGYRDTSAAFIRATIARMYAARRTGAKTEMFGYVPGGYARILQTLERTLRLQGVQLRLGQPVRAITSAAEGGLQIKVDSTGTEKVSHAVVTTAAPLALQICPGLSGGEKNRLANIKYQGIVCASLLLKNSLSPFYITNITDSGIPYTAVIEMSALVDKSQFGGRALVYLPKYLSPGSPCFSQGDEQIRDDFVSALERMYPQFKRSDIVCFQVSRVKYLLPIPTINYSANVPESTTSVPGLHIVNSSQIVDGTLNVNETIRLAETAAQRFAQLAAERSSQSQSLRHEFVAAHS
jgi:protoporphyrinogen oxidase